MAISSRIRVAFAIMTAVLLSARPVYAEDIEIYLVSGEDMRHQKCDPDGENLDPPPDDSFFSGEEHGEIPGAD